MAVNVAAKVLASYRMSAVMMVVIVRWATMMILVIASPPVTPRHVRHVIRMRHARRDHHVHHVHHVLHVSRVGRMVRRRRAKALGRQLQMDSVAPQ